MEANNKAAKQGMTRRTFIKKTGITIFILTSGSIAFRALDQGVFSSSSGPAYEPWDISKNEYDGPLALVADAILAANPHNSQPWLFKVTDTQIELFADEARNLGAMDPFRREMFMGLGCAIENLMLSAAYNEYNPTINYFPHASDPNYVARITLEQGSKKESALYKAISIRHTDRGAYDIERPIPAEIFQHIDNVIEEKEKVKLTWFKTEEEKKLIGDLIVNATAAIIQDYDMSTSSNMWFKENWDDLQESRDGITLDAQGESIWTRAMGKILQPLSDDQNNQFWLKSTRERHTATAGAYGLISVRDASDNLERMLAGRAWQRIHLYGSTQNIGMHPLNQPNEMSDREKYLGTKEKFGMELKKITGDSSWQGLFLFRLGYALKDTLPSPRRSVDQVTF
ncbi:Acg family FMN-binding oxidoreductase [Oceanobacillus saliphilus]|uniref:Acg family FMN-binding oxidoreductase n=1 Tax=Oceanobacillus saliphilus TaxID=2925834 RepID=UPI00201D4862|nr:hypothetical protein [Oceanobacillus saliphilus]